MYDIIKLALREDIGSGDITSNAIIPKNAVSKAKLLVKEDGVIAGVFLLKKFFKKVDIYVKDGDKAKKGTVVAEITDKTRKILAHERVLLNILQRLSGIATLTRKYVTAANGKAKILDTRKTMPGMRRLDKYAVRMGSGMNHRMGLYDMVLIKDNHIQAAGSIHGAVALVRQKNRKCIFCRIFHRKVPKIEVEVGALEQVKDALDAKPDIIMLDNMSLSGIKKAVKIIDHKIIVEASGGMNLEIIPDVARTGVDYISVGALTHSAKALDMSLKIYETS